MNAFAVSILCAIAHAGRWTENSPQTFDVLDVGINSEIGYASAIANGVGPLILKTSDRGQTWNQLKTGANFVAIACSSLNAKDAVVAGVLGKAEFTINGGANWTTAAGVVNAPVSLTRGRLATYYGAPVGHGLSVSLDEGLLWEHRGSPSANSSRFAAIADDNTWYFTAGQFIAPSPPPTPFNEQIIRRRLTSRISHMYDQKTKRGSLTMELVNASVEWTLSEKKTISSRFALGEAPMWGEIWKTSDAGKSFTRLLSDANRYYFNSIDCCNTTLCYAVAEGNTAAGSSQPGARVFKTVDGKNFKQIYFRPGDAESMIGVKCISSEEAYASGSTLALGPTFGGHFFFTNDGGKTWADQTVRAPVLWMDMSNDGKYGLASGLTRLEQSVTFGYE